MLPRITLSTPPIRVIRPPRIDRIAAECRSDGIDLSARAGLVGDKFGPPRSIWEANMPITSLTVHASELSDRSVRAAVEEQLADGPIESLVARLPADVDLRLDHDFAVALMSVSRRRGDFSLLLCVPAAEGVDGRAHLARIRSLKRLAEEWDIGIGFEVDKRTDATWEAEAAVHIAAGRLAFVRIGTSLLSGRGTKSSLPTRVLRACADVQFGGIVSVLPELPLWHAWRHHRIATAYTVHRAMVRRAYGAVVIPTPVHDDPSFRRP